MIVLVADTSGVVAALDPRVPESVGARRALDQAGAIAISPVLLSELDHVARRELGPARASRAIDWIARLVREGRLLLPMVDAGLIETAQRVRRHYADLDLDLADAVTVALAERLETNEILTLDRRDFRAIRPLSHHRAFRLLPDDL